LIFICNMLATSFSNLSWRPVLAVLFGAFLYVICLPMATQVYVITPHKPNSFHSYIIFFQISEQGIVHRHDWEIHRLRNTAGRYSTRFGGHRL
jgi:hypothetical protein